MDYFQDNHAGINLTGHPYLLCCDPLRYSTRLSTACCARWGLAGLGNLHLQEGLATMPGLAADSPGLAGNLLHVCIV